MRSAPCLALLVGCATVADDAADDTDVDGPFAGHPILTQRVLHVAHRGGANLAPEETLVAMDAAVAAGADMLEIDLWQTSDGVLVLMHDDAVDRTTDGTGPVTSFTLAELKALDAAWSFDPAGDGSFPLRGTGVTVATLDEVFSAHPDVLYSLEIKQNSPAIVAPVVAAVRAHGLEDRVVIGAFDDLTVQAVRDAAPDLLTTLATAEAFGLYSLTAEAEALYTAPTPYFAAPLQFAGLVLDEATVDKAHRLGITLHIWTINDPADMDLVLSWDVDGVITDAPDVLEPKLQALGVAVP